MGHDLLSEARNRTGFMDDGRYQGTKLRVATDPVSQTDAGHGQHSDVRPYLFSSVSIVTAATNSGHFCV